MAEEKERGHFLISGKVQGVCFRMDTRDKAEQLGLTGWVRNRSDGKVEVMAEGWQNDLKEFRKWCGKGPAMAYVTGVDEEYSHATGEFDGFRIVY
ncbi:MAG: acylphosphatase [Verrucomicrobiota bacterium]